MIGGGTEKAPREAPCVSPPPYLAQVLKAGFDYWRRKSKVEEGACRLFAAFVQFGPPRSQTTGFTVRRTGPSKSSQRPPDRDRCCPNNPSLQIDILKGETLTRKAWDHGGKSRHERGYGTTWDKLRKTILQRDRHLCQLCEEQGCITVGTHVDHIKAKANGGTDDPANLRVVCAPCHATKTIHDQGKNPRLRKRRTTGLDGWPIKENRE